MNEMRVRVHSSPYAGLEVYICRDAGPGEIEVATSVELETVPEGSCFAPALRLDEKAGQRLMDDLYHAGFRPTEDRVTSLHLGDMRKIVSKFLEVEL